METQICFTTREIIILIFCAFYFKYFSLFFIYDKFPSGQLFSQPSTVGQTLFAAVQTPFISGTLSPNRLLESAGCFYSLIYFPFLAFLFLSVQLFSYLLLLFTIKFIIFLSLFIHRRGYMSLPFFLFNLFLFFLILSFRLR